MNISCATSLDIAYIAEACALIVRFMRSEANDKFISGFSDIVNEGMLRWICGYIESPNAAAFIAEDDSGRRVGCICGSLEESNLSIAVPGQVGEISICWVDRDYQRQGVGRALLGQMEKWFLQHGITHVEVAYMAKNTVAAQAWTQMGFSPFRTFAYKEIGQDKTGRDRETSDSESGAK